MKLIVSYTRTIPGHPVSTGDTPSMQSSDALARVVANVAPLIALTSERNAKEYLRTTSSWYQFNPLATAPLGTLSIFVSAICLSGAGFLGLLVGRDLERRSKALVELTPLSVFPATSVYTPRAVGIQPLDSKDKVTFIRGHVRDVHITMSALIAFWEFVNDGSSSLQLDKDNQINLVI